MTDSKRTKRPRDTNQLAKFIADVATGEQADERPISAERSKAGKKGGKARADSLTDQQRSEIAQIAAQARWKKSDN